VGEFISESGIKTESERIN